MLQDDLTDYPPKPQRPYPKMLRTGQAAPLFLLGDQGGVIRVPYVRTGKLGQSWTYRIETTGAACGALWVQTWAYTKWVQNEDSQAVIHRGNWLTDARREPTPRRDRAALCRATAMAVGIGGEHNIVAAIKSDTDMGLDVLGVPFRRAGSDGKLLTQTGEYFNGRQAVSGQCAAILPPFTTTGFDPRHGQKLPVSRNAS